MIVQAGLRLCFMQTPKTGFLLLRPKLDSKSPDLKINVQQLQTDDQSYIVLDEIRLSVTAI